MLLKVQWVKFCYGSRVTISWCPSGLYLTGIDRVVVENNEQHLGEYLLQPIPDQKTRRVCSFMVHLLSIWARSSRIHYLRPLRPLLDRNQSRRRRERRKPPRWVHPQAHPPAENTSRSLISRPFPFAAGLINMYSFPAAQYLKENSCVFI